MRVRQVRALPKLHADNSSMFVTADPVTTLNRVVIRDIGTNGDTTDETFAFHAEAQEVLIPFLQDQRPWERADLIVDGESGDDGNLLVSERPQPDRAAGRH